jgi:hypothetical protein
MSPSTVASGSANGGILPRPRRIVKAICWSVTAACQLGLVRSGAAIMAPWGPSPRPLAPWQREQWRSHAARTTLSSAAAAAAALATEAAGGPAAFGPGEPGSSV